MNLRMTISVLLATWLAGCDSSSTTTGTSSETVTGVRLYLPNGAPASGARAELFAVSDTGNIPVSQVYVDAQGRLALDAPEKGRYNLVIRHPDGTSLLQDSLLSDGSRISAWSDTLRPAGSVQGRVKVQPKDSPRIAWVHLLGSGVYANVDDSGRFDLDGVAPGRYTVAFLTRDTAYTPTFRSARVWPDSTLDLGTVDLVYTGLPLVTGLAASYDTAEGVLTLKWDRSRDPRVSAYAVYDGVTGNFVLSEMARASDTSRTLRIFPNGGMALGTNGYLSSGDTSVARRSYRIAVVDSAGRIGPAWGSVSMEMPSPFRLRRKEIRWNKIGVIPGLMSSSRSGGWGLVCGIDTLGGELLAYVHDTGEALLGRVLSSPDGMTWRILVDSVPMWGGGAEPGRSDQILPLSWGGELLRVEPHVRDSGLIGNVKAGRRFDSAFLYVLKGGRWERRSSLVLADSINSLWLQPLGSELHLLGLLETGSPGNSAMYHKYAARQELAWDGVAWRDDRTIRDTLAAGGSLFWESPPEFVGGGRWTVWRTWWSVQPYWVRSGLASGIGDALQAPGTNALVGDRGEVYLLDGGAYAEKASPNTWRMLSHVGDMPQGMSYTKDIFWKGNPVIIDYDGAVYMGTVSDP